MNEENFWKLIYIYINNYSYEILHYRPEKKDVWLIDKNNEVYRFIYVDEIRQNEIDSNIYNIIKNEKTLKKSFNLNTLKIKSYYLSSNSDHNTIEYKKYKISNSLIIERLIVTDKNLDTVIKKTNDLSFVKSDSNVERYKNRVISQYKRKTTAENTMNFRFNFISIFFIVVFSLNYLLLNYSNNNHNLYKYINYDYQRLISGDFYRLFTSSFIIEDVINLILIVSIIFICTIIFGENLNIRESVLIYINISLFCSLFLIFNYAIDASISSLSFFGFLGSLFVEELNKRNNNLNFIYSIALPIVYIIIYSFFFQFNIALFAFAFIIGVFFKILYMKKLNVIISYIITLLIIISGVIIVIFNFNLKGKVNEYNYNKTHQRIENNNYKSINELEDELRSNNKSIINYYELGLLKLKNDSHMEAKDIFEKGIEFDDSFAPIYYQLALLYRSELNDEMVLKNIEKALLLDENNEKYKNVKSEVIKK